MLYLKDFTFLSREQEEDYFCLSGDPKTKRTCYSSVYPFGLFRYRELPKFTFEPVTILYGGNGCGKSTLLNVMAEKLGVSRGAVFNRTDFFEDCVSRCEYTLAPGRSVPAESKIITSDDVFDYMLDLRCINDGIDTERASLLAKYKDYRESSYRLTSLSDYDEWRRRNDTKTKRPNKSKYIREHLMANVQTRSNGESALKYFTESITENALYILDEPENSLSAELQLDLKKFLEASARAFRCQFIISTHSPFLLSMADAKVYDLDARPPAPRRWTELENVRIFYDFFREHESQFR